MTYGLNSTLLYPTAYAISPPGCPMGTPVMSKSGPLIFSPNLLFPDTSFSKWYQLSPQKPRSPPRWATLLGPYPVSHKAPSVLPFASYRHPLHHCFRVHYSSWIIMNHA